MAAVTLVSIGVPATGRCIPRGHESFRDRHFISEPRDVRLSGIGTARSPDTRFPRTARTGQGNGAEAV